MSWFQSLKDDFALRPFEDPDTASDGATMASGPSDVTASQEPAEVQEDCSGKKKSKFQTFKKFFARKKRKDPAGADSSGLKSSQSSDNVSKTSENNTLTRSDRDKGSGSKISLGSKAMSHDSIFVSDSAETNEALGASQDSIHGKVKSLQLQLKQAIRLGSPPSLMCVKRTEDAGDMSEDDELPRSPPDYTPLNAATKQTQRNSSVSLEGMESDDDQLSCAASSRGTSLLVPGDFSQPASPFACLDNSAAKHKLGLRQKGCNRRKPAKRLELKTDGEDVMDGTLNTSIAESVDEQKQEKAEDESFDELKPKATREEEDEEEENEKEEEEENKRSQHSRKSLLTHDEEKEEADESEAEQDISHSPDTSSPPEPNLSDEEEEEEEAPHGLPSSKPRSTTSSLDSPRTTPEPPAGSKEYLLDPPGVAYGSEENGVESELVLSEEDDGVQDEEEEEEEESSLLQEVLSSLKTPLGSCSLSVETEGIALEVEEEEMEEREKEAAESKEGEKEEWEEEKEQEEEMDDPLSYEGASIVSPLRAHTPDEEEKEEEEEEEEEKEKDKGGSTLSYQEEVTLAKEEDKSEDDEDVTEEEEELVVERFVYEAHEKEAAARDETEELDREEETCLLTRKSDIQAHDSEKVTDKENETDEEEEEEEEEEKEERMLQKEPVMDEEEWQSRETYDEAENAVEAEDVVQGHSEDTVEMETCHDVAEEEAGVADEGVGAEGSASYTMQPNTSDDEISADIGDQQPDDVQESSETTDEGVEIDPEQKSDPDEDVEASVQEREQEDFGKLSDLEERRAEKGVTDGIRRDVIPAKMPPLSLPESHSELVTQETGTISPSKTSTTTLHINLVSPSAEKVAPFFQQSPPVADAVEPVTESVPPAAASTERVSTDEDHTPSLEEQMPDIRGDGRNPDPVEETAQQPLSRSEQNKVRFTIAPAWQRSHSLSPPSSPPPRGEEEEEEATTNKDSVVKAEPASSPKVKPVLSPTRPSPPLPSTKPQTSAVASTEESPIAVDGKPDNPFGVRLRKTAAVHLFSSEEENTETAIESPAQPASCKAEPPQPVVVKPSVNPPVSNRPALPKKPDVHGDGGVKTKRISDPVAARGGSSGSDSPSWISVAKQKQKIYKENSFEVAVKKEEQEKKVSLPVCVSSASSKTAEVTGKVSSSVEKETRRDLSPPTPVPPQPLKAQVLPSAAPSKPHIPAVSAKPAEQRPLLAPTPVPNAPKPTSCTSPSCPPKPTSPFSSSKTPQPLSAAVTPSFSSRTTPEKPASRAPAPSQRGQPNPALTQDEPPWMALAKKKAKAWSEMPQIVQ